MAWFGRGRREDAERAAAVGELDAAIRGVEEQLPRDRRTGRFLIVASVLALLASALLALFVVGRAIDVGWDLGARIDVFTRFGPGGGPLWFILVAYGIIAAVFVGGAVVTLARPFSDLRRSEALLRRFRAERAALDVAGDDGHRSERNR